MAEKKQTFEDKLNELEEIIEKLDSDEVKLDEMLKLYERAIILIKEEKETLNEAKEKIKSLE